jgi:hypothetical protein
MEQLIELIDNCVTMVDITYITKQVHESFDEHTTQNAKNEILHKLSDKTFDVFIELYPKQEVKKVSKKMSKKVVSKKKTSSKKDTTKTKKTTNK